MRSGPFGSPCNSRWKYIKCFPSKFRLHLRRRNLQTKQDTGHFQDFCFREIRPSKKKNVSRPDFYKKESGRAVFFCYLLFPIACFLYTLLPSPRDTLELLGQILIKQNIRYWLNTSLFNFDTHKGLTVKIYIILVCTQQQWAGKRHLSILSFFVWDRGELTSR